MEEPELVKQEKNNSGGRGGHAHRQGAGGPCGFSLKKQDKPTTATETAGSQAQREPCGDGEAADRTGRGRGRKRGVRGAPAPLWARLL